MSRNLEKAETRKALTESRSPIEELSLLSAEEQKKEALRQLRLRQKRMNKKNKRREDGEDAV